MPPGSPADKSSNWEWPLPLLPLPFKLFTSRTAPSHSNEVVSSSPPPILIQVNQMVWLLSADWLGTCPALRSACGGRCRTHHRPATPLFYNWLLSDQNSQVLRIRLWIYLRYPASTNSTQTLVNGLWESSCHRDSQAARGLTATHWCC